MLKKLLHTRAKIVPRFFRFKKFSVEVDQRKPLQYEGAFARKLIENIGAVSLFSVGAILGALLFSKDFTVKKGDFTFSTDGNTHAMARLEYDYKLRVEHLRVKAKNYHDQFDSQATTPEAKKEIVKEVVSYYLVPTSHDHLFGHDIVLFNGKGKPTILKRRDFDEIQDHWARVLASAGIKNCIDTFRIDTEFSAWDESVYRKAYSECFTKYYKNTQ